jgi:hypothetical protein
MHRPFALALSCVALFGCGLIDDGSTKMGKGIDMPDSAWIVVSATDLGKSLPATASFASFKKPLTTTGRYVRVQYKITPKEKFIFIGPPSLVDATAHELKPLDDFPYTGAAGLSDLKPGTIGDLGGIYEIPADAKKVRAKIDGHHSKGIPVLVDLKL